MTSVPYLIVTLRRTGGTSLTNFLSEISPFPTGEHEPFNPDRRWGHITQAFRNTRDVETLEAAVSECLISKSNIKHCIDATPIRLTQVLLRAAHRQGYRIYLLTRRSERRRLESLFLALSTGAWGVKEAKEIYPAIISGARQPQRFNLDEVRRQIQLDASALGQTLSALRYEKLPYRWLVFEELYFSTAPLEEIAIKLVAELGGDVEKARNRIFLLSGNGNQRSGSIAAHVPGFNQVRQIIRECTLY